MYNNNIYWNIAYIIFIVLNNPDDIKTDAAGIWYKVYKLKNIVVDSRISNSMLSDMSVLF